MNSVPCVLVFSICVKIILSIDPLVLTSHGLVLGSRPSDGNYSMFLGVPYAKVDPDNPFGAPVETDVFQDVYAASDDSAVCPQREDFNYTVVGTLDCLRVNVYVPHSATSQNLLPVMIWIHGGGYRRGFSNRHSYGPKFIVRHNVLLITFNYRLSVYGFLSLDTPEIPGNAGLKDQLAALRWIKRNIVAFGGDPNNITLFGQSAGASSVEFHMLSGLSAGLFHKVIMESGTVLSDWVMADPDASAPLKMAMHLGLHTNDLETAIDFLKQASPIDVIKATIDLNYLFKPCVEKQFDGVEAMIKDLPSVLMQSGSYSNVPILSGFNSIERLEDIYYFEQSENYFETADKTFEGKLDLQFNFTDEEFRDASEILRYFYIGDGRSISESVFQMIDFDSDLAFVHPMHRSTFHHMNRNGNSMYQYMFTYSGGRNYMKQRLNITLDGVSHADEIGYLFDQSYMTSPINANDQILIDRLTTMWTNFAKYSNPTPSITELIPIKWEAIDKDDPRFLIIGRDLHMSHHPYHQRMAFLDVLFSLYKDKMKW